MWWTWRKRYAAELRAERADREASARAELADLGRAAHALAHDLGNLLALVHINASAAELLERQQAREALVQVKEAARSAYRMFEQWRGTGAPSSPESAAVLVTTLCGLLRRTGLRVETRIEGAPRFDGNDADAVCALENLLLNAAREAIRAGQPEIQVAVTDAQIRITNPVRDAEHLDERIYEEGVSFEGSTGRGLTIARAAAERVGWRIFHAVSDDRVTFVIQRR
jgi:signal transduction histidine kinase